jgi:hypothetical protein
VRRKYKEYGINEKPFVVVKADNGTYGMGIMTVRDAKELDALNRKTEQDGRHQGRPDGQRRHHPGRRADHERMNDAVAEPVVYMMDRYVVGGFYRMHAERGVDENLNAPGASFRAAGLRAEHAPAPAGRAPGASAPNRFYMYGVIGRLAMLAASYELEATDPDAEGLRLSETCPKSCCVAIFLGGVSSGRDVCTEALARRPDRRKIAIPSSGTPLAGGAFLCGIQILACGAHPGRHRCRLWRHRHQRPVCRQGGVRLRPCALHADNVYGILSIFFWTLTVIVSLKYVVLVLRADNNGEGGLVAMLALASQAVKDKPELREHAAGGGHFRHLAVLWRRGHHAGHLGAVGGRGPGGGVAHFKKYVIPLTLVMLFGLFAVQKRGTAASASFSGRSRWCGSWPLRCWACAHASHPEILWAISPHYALGFMWHQPGTTFIILGAVVLCVTGGEALYADLGHFGKSRSGWPGLVVMPSLTLNYFGQGALLLANPEAVKNPFFMMAPDWALIPAGGAGHGWPR